MNVTAALLLDRWKHLRNQPRRSKYSKEIDLLEECPHCGGMGRVPAKMRRSGFRECGICGGHGSVLKKVAEAQRLPWRLDRARRLATCKAFRERKKAGITFPRCYYCHKRSRTQIRRDVIVCGKTVSKVIPYCGDC